MKLKYIKFTILFCIIVLQTFIIALPKVIPDNIDYGISTTEIKTSMRNFSSLSAIAKEYYFDGMKWKLIAKHNKIKNPGKLKKNTEIIVPIPEHFKYKNISGNVLFKRFDTDDWKDIKKNKNIFYSNTIFKTTDNSNLYLSNYGIHLKLFSNSIIKLNEINNDSIKLSIMKGYIELINVNKGINLTVEIINENKSNIVIDSKKCYYIVIERNDRWFINNYSNPIKIKDNKNILKTNHYFVYNQKENKSSIKKINDDNSFLELPKSFTPDEAFAGYTKEPGTYYIRIFQNNMVTKENISTNISHNKPGQFITNDFLIPSKYTLYYECYRDNKLTSNYIQGIAFSVEDIAPPLFVESPKNGTLFMDDIYLNGQTWENCNVYINKKKIALENGFFNTKLSFKTGINIIKVTAEQNLKTERFIIAYKPDKSTVTFFNNNYDSIYLTDNVVKINNPFSNEIELILNDKVYSKDYIELQNGLNSIVLNIRKKNLILFQDSVKYSFFVDMEPPVLNNITILPSRIFSNDTITVIINAYDNGIGLKNTSIKPNTNYKQYLSNYDIHKNLYKIQFIPNFKNIKYFMIKNIIIQDKLNNKTERTVNIIKEIHSVY